MMLRKKLPAIAMFIAWCLLSGMALAKGSDITVRTGLATRDDHGKFEIYRDTTTIPFVSKSSNPNYYFGVAASAAPGKQFMCRFVLYIPKQNAVHARDDYSRSRLDELEAADTYSIVKVKEALTDKCEVFLRLDDEDVPGQYFVEIYVGGKLAQKVQFDVEKK